MSLRVVGGRLRGRKLGTVPGLKTRPTADRTREAIFNILGPSVRGSRVLDLFAGTGACGIEALSRGAAFSVFVEIGREALTVLKRNIAACALTECTRVVARDALKNLDCLRDEPEKFSLVFIDPPYHRALIPPALANLNLAGCLENGAEIVVEHGADEPLDAPGASFRMKDRRRYGKTLVSFLDYVL